MIRQLLMSLGLSACLITPAFSQERVVHIYNWSDYIDPKVLEDFTKETGIEVVYDTYDNNEIIEAKLLAGKSGYDIVVPSGPFVYRLIQANVLQRLDMTKLPNASLLWPEIMQGMQSYDPENAYALPYMWGTTGIALNIPKVQALLGKDTPLDSFDLLMKPEYSEKIKKCGIQVLDSPEDFLPGIMNYLGLDPQNVTKETLDQTISALQKIRPNIQKFHSSEFINALASGQICMAVAYSGDIIQSRNRAIEAKNGIEVRYVIPKEGAQMWVDSFIMPADAPHKEEAYILLNYMMRPEIAALNSKNISYASGILKAKEFIPPELAEDKGIYPSPEILKILFTVKAYDPKQQKLVTRSWSKLKSGR